MAAAGPGCSGSGVASSSSEAAARRRLRVLLGHLRSVPETHLSASQCRGRAAESPPSTLPKRRSVPGRVAEEGWGEAAGPLAQERSEKEMCWVVVFFRPLHPAG